MIGTPGPMPRIIPEARYVSIPSAVVGAEARSERAELRPMGAIVDPVVPPRSMLRD